MKIAGATLNQTPFAWENNLKNIINAINQARDNSVDLLCLPELALTGYGCQDVFLSDWIYEDSLKYLKTLLPETEGVTVNVGVPFKFEGVNYNCVAVISDKEILGISAKQNLANDGVHYETRWFKPWESGRTVDVEVFGETVPFGDIIYQLEDTRVAFEICEDAWSTQRPGFAYCQKGIDIILNPSASHFAFGKSKLREELVLNSSRELNCTYVYSNLNGNEAGRMIYDGEVLIADKGKLVSRNQLCSFKKVELVLEGLIIPQMSKNEEFLRASRLALYDYMRKTYSKGFVLSLSGGADSSTCAVLVAEMLKTAFSELTFEELKTDLGYFNLNFSDSSEEQMPKVLHTAYQSTVNSGDVTFNAAKSLAKDINASFHDWSVNDVVEKAKETMQSVIGRELSWEKDDLALQNIQARSRSPFIWMLTNLTGGLLITTSNRSEGGMGYATMDGDTSGGIAPIAGVDKDFVRKWLVWAEKELGYASLSLVNEQAPTAELRPSSSEQRDEEDLMPYDTMVEIERLAIKNYMSPNQVFEMLNSKLEIEKDLLRDYINKFFQKWSINQWKRERIAPCFHLDDFNVDPKTWYRFPIISGGFEKL